MGGGLRDAGEDLYDIRRGSAAFGRFVGAGRRRSGGSWELVGGFREVRGSWSALSGGFWLALSCLAQSALARRARKFDDFS